MVRIRWRSLQRRMTLHDGVVRRFARPGGHAGFRHRALGAVLQWRTNGRRCGATASDTITDRCRRCRRRSTASGRSVLGTRLFHLDVVLQLLQRNFAGRLVDDDDALFGVVALVAFEYGFRLAGRV